jgi:hypothetical protein
MPYGLLVKVTAIDGTIIEATEATLRDALEQGEFVVEKSFSPSDVTGESLLEGVTAVPASSSLLAHGGDSRVAPGGTNEGPGLAFNYGVTDVEIAPGVIAGGSVGFDIGCGAYASLSWTLDVYFEASCGVTQSGSIQITSEFVGAVIETQKKIATLDLAPITFWVGPVPIVLVPQIGVYVGVNGTFAVGMNVGASESFGAKVGIKYDDGFDTIKELDNGFSASVVTGSGHLSAGGHVAMGEALLLYGLAGPQLSETLFLKLEGAAPGAKPLWCLKGGLSVAASLKLDLGVTELEYGPAVLKTIDADLGCAENTAPVVTASTSADVIYPQSVTEPPTITASATDAEDGALPVTWSSSIDGDLGSTPPGQSLDPRLLSFGTHTITVTATDPEGRTTSFLMNIEVQPGNPTATIEVKNAAGVWAPATNVSGVQGSQIAVRVVSDSHLALGIGDCLPVAWNSPLPVDSAGSCDYVVTLSTQGSHSLVASVTDADGLSGSATLTATVSAPPAVVAPQFSLAITARRTTPFPFGLILCDGCAIEPGETVKLSVGYLNFAAAKVPVTYRWTVRQTYSNGTTPPTAFVPVAGTDASPNAGSERTFTVPSVFSAGFTYNFKVEMLNAAGTVVDTRVFTLVRSGDIG